MFNEQSKNSISKISKIIFNEKLEKIESNAFKNIKSLDYLKLPKSIKYIGNNSFNNAFVEDFSKVVFNNKHKLLKNKI